MVTSSISFSLREYTAMVEEAEQGEWAEQDELDTDDLSKSVPSKVVQEDEEFVLYNIIHYELGRAFLSSL